MINGVASRLLAPAVRSAVQTRAQSVVAGPPSVHISKAEKIFLGGGMVASLLVVPGWVVYHIKDYKGDN